MPIIWYYAWLDDVKNQLVTWENPDGKINNSDLELARGTLHQDALVHNYNVQERTTLSKTDNLATLF